MSKSKPTNTTINVRMRVREFSMPPVHDALVLGTDSPIGCEALRRALALLSAAPFEHIEPHDDVVGDILVRAAILKRIPVDRFSKMVLEKFKPLMTPRECMHLDIDVDLTLDHDL